MNMFFELYIENINFLHMYFFSFMFTLKFVS